MACSSCDGGCHGNCYGSRGSCTCQNGCGGNCSTCSTSCGGGCKTGCTGCDSSCSGTCKTGCDSSCTGTCKTGCDGSCKTGCSSCSGGCSGCSGCSGGCSGCSGGCTSCDNACSNANMQNMIKTLGENILVKGYIKDEDFLDLRNTMAAELTRRGKASLVENFTNTPTHGNYTYPEHMLRTYNMVQKLNSSIDYRSKAVAGNIIKMDDIDEVISHIRKLITQQVKKG